MQLSYRVSKPDYFFKLFSKVVFNGNLTSNISIVKNIILLAAIGANKELHVMLADDDEDDRNFFQEAVTESVPNVKITTVSDGDRLIEKLLSLEALPQVVFLDLNMPVKNGWECLREIRSNEKLKQLPVVIYSTSSNREHIEETYRIGASFYIRKPDSYKDLKQLTRKVFSLEWGKHFQPSREKYLLTA